MASNIKKICFACDAGMGSSAMGATTLKKKIQKAGLDIKVVHTAIEDVPSDAEMIVTHKSLAARARNEHPNTQVVEITNFVGAPEYDQIVADLLK
jgi:PTS system mannitol-specific IIC component